MIECLLVIGGSRGGGREVALAAGAKGAKVVLVARGPDDLRKTALDLLRRGALGTPILADAATLGDSAAAERLLGGAWQYAGVFPSALVLATPEVRAGVLGPLAMLIRRSAQKGMTRLVVFAGEPKILEEIDTALDGVPGKVDVHAIAPGAHLAAIEALGL